MVARVSRRRSEVMNLRRRVGIFRRLLRRVEARGKYLGDRISGFWSREILEHVCGVGFVRRCLDLRRSDKLSHGLLESVDLGHGTAPRWLRDAVESRSSREACSDFCWRCADENLLCLLEIFV